MLRILVGGFFGTSAVTLTSKGGFPLLQNYTGYNSIGGLLHLGPDIITFRTLLHLGLYYI